MSSSEVERFLSDLQKDAGLRQEFEKLGQDTDANILWANAKGYAFTRAEADHLGVFDADLSDDDLEQVAGGWCGNELTTDG